MANAMGPRRFEDDPSQIGRLHPTGEVASGGSTQISKSKEFEKSAERVQQLIIRKKEEFLKNPAIPDSGVRAINTDKASYLAKLKNLQEKGLY